MKIEGLGLLTSLRHSEKDQMTIFVYISLIWTFGEAPHSVKFSARVIQMTALEEGAAGCYNATLAKNQF